MTRETLTLMSPNEMSLVVIPAVSRRGGDIVATSGANVHCLHENSKNTGAISSKCLWALSGLLASMSLYLGSVALAEVLTLAGVIGVLLE